MKKIITAIGNENINSELKKQKNINIIINDIQYKEGILEVLEKNEELDFIILSSILPGELELKELIKKIIEINKKIKIILICESKDEELEKYLYNKGVYKIIYDNEIEINDLINIINYNSENDELKDEINKLKNIILENNKINNKKEKNNKIKINKKENKNIIKRTFNKLKNIILKLFNNKNNNLNNEIYNNIKFNSSNKNSKKIICIIGPAGVGKSIISINLAKSNIYCKNKVLIIDSDFFNNSIQTILGLKNNSNKNKINKKIDLYNLNQNILKNEIYNKDKIIDEKNTYKNNFYLKLTEIINSINNYDYIIIDTNFNNLELNKKIIELSDKTIFISDTNLSEINKSIKLLDKYINYYKIDKNKFNIVFNKYNDCSIDLKILYKIFSEFKIIGYLKYNKKYNQLINKNNRNNFINKKIRKEYLKIKNQI